MTQNIGYGEPGYLLIVVGYLKIIVATGERETALFVYKRYDKYIFEFWRG
jgi:hypothetical protein